MPEICAAVFLCSYPFYVALIKCLNSDPIHSGAYPPSPLLPSPFTPFLTPPLEVGTLKSSEGVCGALWAPPAGPGRARPPNDI